MKQVGQGAPRAGRADQRGFTLVELVVIIIVVGVLAAAAAGRLVSPDTFTARSYVDQSNALLRFAQKTAVAQNRDVWVVLAANGIRLCSSATCGAGTRIISPGGENSLSATTLAACAGDRTWACEAPPNGVTAATTATFYFDALGKPGAPVAVAPVVQVTFPLTVTIVNGATTRTVTVEQETGYVH